MIYTCLAEHINCDCKGSIAGCQFAEFIGRKMMPKALILVLDITVKSFLILKIVCVQAILRLQNFRAFI